MLQRARPLVVFLAFASCGGGSGGHHASPGTPYWVSIDASGSTVATASVSLHGTAFCDACPPSEGAFGGCPVVQGPFESAVAIGWTNVTTGESGDAFHAIEGHCACLFSYCLVDYEHGWLADVPLAMGDNEIVLVASGGGGEPATSTIVVTRVPAAPTGVVATSGHGTVTIRWDPVAGASAYELLWAESATLDPRTALRIPGVTSPYVLTGIADDTPCSCAVIATSGDLASAPSATVTATAGWVVESVTIPELPLDALDVSLALDPLAEPRILASRYDHTTFAVRDDLASRSASGWSSIEVGPAAWWHGDVAIDAAGDVHVGYLGTRGLVHVTSADPTPEIVDPEGWCDARLALDAGGVPHFLYRVYELQPAAVGIVRHATKVRGAWTIEDVDAADIGCSPTASTLAIAIEPDGTPHLA